MISVPDGTIEISEITESTDRRRWLREFMTYSPPGTIMSVHDIGTVVAHRMSVPSLYARLLGPDFDRLAPVLQSIHDARTTKLYVGRCDIRGGDGWLARLIARVAGLPVACTDVPVEVTIDCDAATESWVRMFGAHRMQSRLAVRNRRLEERLGPIVLAFELTAEQDRIVWTLHSARLALLPVPLTWLLRCAATEAIHDGRYGFDVSAHVRGIGLIVHYRGWLVSHDSQFA